MVILNVLSDGMVEADELTDYGRNDPGGDDE